MPTGTKPAASAEPTQLPAEPSTPRIKPTQLPAEPSTPRAEPTQLPAEPSTPRIKPSKPSAEPKTPPANVKLTRTNRAFRHVYTATAISKLGTAVGTLAVPLVAQLVLHSSPAAIGLLTALNTGAFLLIGLPAGAWVERMRRRRVLIGADLTRAALFGSVPVAAFLGILTFAWLCAVVAVCGVATVFFDVAAFAYVPHVVGRDRLVEANASLVGIDAAGQIAGRGLGGLLVQALTASGVVALDALSYLASALFLLRVRKPEPEPASRSDGADGAGAGPNLRAEVLEGLRFVLGHRDLRPLVLKGALANLSTMLVVTLLPTLFVRDFGAARGPALLGVFLAAGAVGSFLGARSAPRLGRRYGAVRTMWLASLVSAPISLLVPLIGRGPWLVAAGLSWAVTLGRVGVDNVLGVSLRQTAAPEEMAGRVNATFRFLLFGALALGSLLAGVIGGAVGIRACLWAGAVGLALVWVPAYFSALRDQW